MFTYWPGPAVRSAARPAHRSRGLTLMEALVAVSLVSVTAGAAVYGVAPMLHSSAGRSATQQVTAALRLTRMKAIAQNRRFRVAFDTEHATYTIQREATPGNFVTDEGPFELPGGARIGSVTPGNPIFDSRGGASAPTTITAGVPHAGYHTVTINLLGKVRVS